MKLMNTETAFDRPLVNYIWINRDKAIVDDENPVCAIQMGHILRAFENINKYPEADFQLWVDSRLLDDYTALCLKCFIRDNAQHLNFTLRDLQDIPDYANNPHFVPPESGDEGYISDQFNNSGPRNVYSRADYARILVLDHCLHTCPENSRIIYSDIDCRDINLPDVLPIIDRHGIALHDLGPHDVSPGYIGIAANNANIRKHFKTLKSETCDAARNNKLGYKAVRHFLEVIGMPYETWRSKIALRNLLPPIETSPPHIRYRLPPDDMEAWKTSRQPRGNSLIRLT